MDCFKDLMDIAVRSLEGEKVENEELQELKDGIRNSLTMVKTELNSLLKLYNCQDLWEVKSLTRRIGFDGELLYGNPDQSDSTSD